MISVYFAFRVIGLVLGILWCKDVLGRFDQDRAELRQTQVAARRTAILFRWGLTVVVLVLIIAFIVRLVLPVARSFGAPI